MRHAYLITAHTNWKLLNLLLQTFDKAETDFFLLIDRKINTPLSELICVKLTQSRLIEVPRIEINWGDTVKYKQRWIYYRMRFVVSMIITITCRGAIF